MKLAKILQGTLGVACVAAAVPQERSPSVVRLSFNKRYGDSYENSSPYRLRKRTNDNVDVNLTNRQNFYSVTMRVGTPSQEIVVLIDTGSSDMWVTGANNPACQSSRDGVELDDNIFTWLSSLESEISWVPTATATYSSGSTLPTDDGGGSTGTIDCARYGTFNSSNSSTFRSNATSFSISYGDGSFASGVWGTDVVNLAGLNISGVSFAVANDTNSTVGVLGIGLPGLESTYSGQTSVTSGDRHQYANFPMVLRERGYIRRNVYSLFLDSPSATSGSILFGAVDNSKYDGQLYTIPILNRYRSQGASEPLQFDVTLQGLGMSNGSSSITFTTTPIPALLDSGTTLAYLPVNMIEMIASSLGATYSSTVGYYVMPCPSRNDETSIVFDFGGFHINANLSDLILDSNSGSCVLGLSPISGNSAILGDLFLVNAYVVYDLENYEISMAQANYNSGPEDVQIVSSTVPNARAAAGYSSTYSSSQSITSGGDIFTSTSGTFTSSSGTSAPSNTFSRSPSSRSSRSRSQNLAPSLVADSSSLFATIVCALSLFL